MYLICINLVTNLLIFLEKEVMWQPTITHCFTKNAKYLSILLQSVEIFCNFVLYNIVVKQDVKKKERHNRLIIYII